MTTAEAYQHAPSGGTARAPLAGLRVVDLSRLVAGNMLTLQLADFGADVIKVEALSGGDPLRHWISPMPDGTTFDAWWQVYGRNKRSLALDLRAPQARDILLTLLDTADVLVESFKPGTLEQMGLAPDALAERFVRLVIVRVSGWGQSGPYSELPGFGSLVEGICGFAHLHPGEHGTPTLPNLALADMVAGVTGAFATLGALRQVECGDGRGQVIDLSLLEPMLAIMGPQASAWARAGVLPDPRTKIASPRGVYRCVDGAWISLSGSTEKMAERVFRAIGRGDDYDERVELRSNAGRLARDLEIDVWIGEFVATRSQHECLDYFRARGVTVGPIHDIEGLSNDPHVVAREAFVSHYDADGETILMHQPTPRLQRTPGKVRSLAPALGEHTQAILHSAGYALADIDAWQGAGVIGCT